jgi:hypothetical protein
MFLDRAIEVDRFSSEERRLGVRLEKLRFGVIPKKVGGSAARGQVYFVCIRNLLKFDQIFIRQES